MKVLFENHIAETSSDPKISKQTCRSQAESEDELDQEGRGEENRGTALQDIAAQLRQHRSLSKSP